MIGKTEIRNVPWIAWIVVALGLLAAGCTTVPQYTLVLRNGTIYDGSGSDPIQGDTAIHGDMITSLGQLQFSVRRYLGWHQGKSTNGS